MRFGIQWGPSPGVAMPRSVTGRADMKRIDAVIREQNLEGVKNRLHDIGVEGLTIAEVKGYGQQKRIDYYRGNQYLVDLLPKLLLTIIAADEQVPEILEAIVQGARTGKIGDGKIFVSSLEEVVRIRSGQIDRAAV
jgi:nitrogen regulatory protein PII